jgi:pilus assembly protein CpaD
MMMIKTSTAFKQILLASIGAGILTACAVPTPSYAPTPLRNQIKVAESIERLELYARPEGLELSARDQFAVGQFLESYRVGGDGPLYVNLPAGKITGAGTQQANTLLRTMMAQAGINPAALQTGEYQSEADAPSPVVVSYRTLRAIPADCRFMDDLTRTYNNQPSQSFGCSQNANLAAMVADPRQFLEPYPAASPNSQRRTVVYDKYIKGESTAAERPPQQSEKFDAE